MNETDAKKRAKVLVGFMIHLFWFTVVNIFLYILDFSRDGQINWAYWTTLGWGIGIISHAFRVFVGSDIEDKLAQKLMDQGVIKK
jgi:two-component system, LytTR family, sensor kinase